MSVLSKLTNQQRAMLALKDLREKWHTNPTFQAKYESMLTALYAFEPDIKKHWTCKSAMPGHFIAMENLINEESSCHYMVGSGGITIYVNICGDEATASICITDCTLDGVYG
jgi:hypothetical protein